MSKKTSKSELRPGVLREAMMRRVHRRIGASGSMLLPAAPSLLETYVEMLLAAVRPFGRYFAPDAVVRLRDILREKLDEAYTRSPYSRIHISWDTDPQPAVSISYVVSVRHSSMEAEYEEWTRERKPPLFGTHPDTKVLALAASLGKPADVRILDIGAGTGRNTLALARAGYPMAAVEGSPALCKILEKSAKDEGLDVELFGGNALDRSLPIPSGRYQLVILCEVVYHLRTLLALRELFERCAEVLAPGGLLCFSAFVADGGFTPDRLTRELAEVFWSTIQTRAELRSVMEGLPFSPVSDESVYGYEKEHLPAEAWPPTGWFADWTRGRDAFDVPEGTAPIELRWLVYKRSS
jgi:SAM-dependent methyltransferase